MRGQPPAASVSVSVIMPRLWDEVATYHQDLLSPSRMRRCRAHLAICYSALPAREGDKTNLLCSRIYAQPPILCLRYKCQWATCQTLCIVV